jgi:hypothetical protein
MHLGLKVQALCAQVTTQGSPAALLKLQMAPRLMLIMSSGSKKKEPRCECLSQAEMIIYTTQKIRGSRHQIKIICAGIVCHPSSVGTGCSCSLCYNA